MANEPLTDDEREGALGAIVAACETSGDSDLAELAVALREGGSLSCWWLGDEGEAVSVTLAVPPGRPLSNHAQLEQSVFDIASRALATCGLYVRNVKISLALAKTGWRSGPRTELANRLAGRFEREASIWKKGGFGDIYRAKDLATGDNTAVKVLRLPSNEGKAVREQHFLRFRREMQMMSRLDHPNVMPVLWYGEEEGGQLWYAMPLAEGSLEDRLAEFPDDPDRVLSVLGSICEGVDYLHAQGIVHRDLSPGNVLCMPDGSWVISDLGLAFDLDRDLTQLTTTGMLMGTIGYRPPDAEAQLAKSASASWDIYSLGQLLADMADGRKYGERPASVPDCMFRAAIARACHQDPAKRFPTVRDLLAECRKLVELSVPWENPDEQRSRLANPLRNGDVAAIHDLAIQLGGGAEIAPFVEALCAMSPIAMGELARSSPDDLLQVVQTFVRQMPGSWTRYEDLDSMASFVVNCSELLSVDELSESVLVWLLEVGHNWNRWNVQSQANVYLRRLAAVSLDVVTRALNRVDARALPEDLDWLHPAARPEPEVKVDETYPF